MNRHESRMTMPGEAQIQFLDADFRIIKPGNFVRCAVTGVPIPIDELRYWSVDRQEAYSSPEAVLQESLVRTEFQPAISMNEQFWWVHLPSH